MGCCYRPPSSNLRYLENIGSILDKVCDCNVEIVFMGDLNINWLDKKCPLMNHLSNITNGCLKQKVPQPTRIRFNDRGVSTATCIHHIFLSVYANYNRALSVPVGCSDPNMVIIVKNANAKPKIVFKRSYRNFSQEAYLKDI